MKDSKCVVIGDLNLDHHRWQNPDHRVQKMVQITKDEIETSGFLPIVEYNYQSMARATKLHC